MRAVVVEEFGGPEVVTLGDVSEPEPAEGEVLIDVRAASVNPIDVKLISGMLGEQSFPVRTGYDAAGVVRAVGAGVQDFQPGDEVFGLGRATHADRALLTATVKKPEQWSWEEAAAVGVGGETAFRGLSLLGVGPDSTVLIDGATGGVGTFAVQLAVARGATVIGTSSEANHVFLASLGAIPISYGDGLAERVAAAAPNGVDAVFDIAGKTDAGVLVQIAPRPEQVVSIANFGAGEAGARVTGGGEVDRREALQAVADLAVSGSGSAPALVVTIDKQYPFTQAAEAFALSAGGHVRGKVVLVP